MHLFDERDVSDWEWVLALGVGYLLVQRAEEAGGLLKGFASLFAPPVALAQGAGIPMQGGLTQDPAVLTPLDPKGFPDLYNSALQVVEAGPLDPNWWTPDWSPVPRPPDPDYDVPARIFAMQAAVETDSGRSCYQFNLGNLTTNKGHFYLNPHVKQPLKFASFNFPLQGAVAHVDRVKRLWPQSYKAAYSGLIHSYAELAPQYAGVSVEQLAKAMRGQGAAHGWLDGVAGTEFPEIRLGDEGDLVEMWQRIVGVKPDGIFGPVTARATAEWQKTHGLKPDGIVGPRTWSVAVSLAPTGAS